MHILLKIMAPTVRKRTQRKKTVAIVMLTAIKIIPPILLVDILPHFSFKINTHAKKVQIKRVAPHRDRWGA
jgi:hypothetical protein